jgi:hypothetical protein
MSTIAPSSSGEATTLLQQLASKSVAYGQSRTSQADSDAPDESSPATVVELSDDAKAIIARAKTDQAVADWLQANIDGLKGRGGKPPSAQHASDPTDLYKQISSLSAAQADDGTSSADAGNSTQWEAGSKWGDASISDAEFAEKYESSFSWWADEFDQYLPPEKGQALRQAIASGTLKFQKASEVEGLNTHSTITYTTGPGGVGQGMSWHFNSHPTGAAKEAIDQGNAFVTWTEDRGDVYVTW